MANNYFTSMHALYLLPIGYAYIFLLFHYKIRQTFSDSVLQTLMHIITHTDIINH